MSAESAGKTRAGTLGVVVAEPLALQWRTLLASIVDLAVRADVMRAQLVRRDPERFFDGIRDLLERFAGGEREDRHVIAAFTGGLAHPETDSVRERLLELARLSQSPTVRDLLGLNLNLVGNPEELAPTAVQRMGESERPLSLGERKSLARTSDRMLLARALRDPHPHVVQILLLNPGLTEDNVIRMAARRPTLPETQCTITRDSRWAYRPRVRAALAQNPATPPYLAALHTCLLMRPVLEDIVATPSLPRAPRHAALRTLMVEPKE
ncbi:MAG: hypothetical protein SGI86_19790 [Deltaproteobacteria bacterium]|nr:hypothetical protein [Deltaproteobacteria bacterium]